MRVVYPSTPASYFHLLRWQGRDPVEKPLIVFTPKSLLRHPRCVSSLQDLAEGSFRTVLDDTIAPEGVRRVVFCTGKLYYDLLKAREEAGARHVAIVRVEQLYPVPAAELGHAIARYPPTAELSWAQEEPRNMGPWRFVREQFLDDIVPEAARRELHYIGREASAAPASGSHKLHVLEQDAITREALRE
jgi:2-oxoglutarate dehydrogenase E1 component